MQLCKHKPLNVDESSLYHIAAYLMGCPIRGVILDPIVAMQMGIQGQVNNPFIRISNSDYGLKMTIIEHFSNMRYSCGLCIKQVPL